MILAKTLFIFYFGAITLKLYADVNNLNASGDELLNSIGNEKNRNFIDNSKNISQEFDKIIKSPLSIESVNSKTTKKVGLNLDSFSKKKSLDARYYFDSLQLDSLIKLKNYLYEKLSQHETRIEPNNQTFNIALCLSLGILIFALILTSIFVLFLYRRNQGIGTYAFKLFGIILILTSSLFLITAGYSSSQMTPIIGLLGTIAGYIFGSSDKKSNSKEL